MGQEGQGLEQWRAHGGAGQRDAQRLEAEAETRFARLEKGFRLLDSVAQLAPLLGLGLRLLASPLATLALALALALAGLAWPGLAWLGWS